MLPSRRHRPRRTIAAALGVLALGLGGCGALVPDGDALARAAAEGVVADIGAHSDNTTSITLVEMVDQWVPREPVYASPGVVVVEPLAWSGAIGTDTEPTIDLRVQATVDAHSASSLGDRSYGAGEAVLCFRLVWARYDEARRSEITCPQTPTPPRPVPEPRPSFDDGDRERVAMLLAASHSPDGLRADLRAAFPGDHVSIETALWEGETVVAVGIPRERECILLVKDGGGVVREEGYRRISLEPGEVGCSTSLYTSPPF